MYVFIELGPVARQDELDQVIAFFHPSTRGVLVRVDDPPVAEISWKISVACQITLLPPWLITSKGPRPLFWFHGTLIPWGRYVALIIFMQ